MPLPSPVPKAPPDLIAHVFQTEDETLRTHAIALLLSEDVARSRTQAEQLADDILQDAQVAALRHTSVFVTCASAEERLNRAKSFVWNAVRSARGSTFTWRRRFQRASDSVEDDAGPPAHESYLERLSPGPDGIGHEVVEARRDLIAALPRALDRLVIQLADAGYAGQGMDRVDGLHL